MHYVCCRVDVGLASHWVAWSRTVSLHTTAAQCESCVTRRPTLIGQPLAVVTNRRVRRPTLLAAASHGVMAHTVRQFDAGRRFHHREQWEMEMASSVRCVHWRGSMCVCIYVVFVLYCIIRLVVCGLSMFGWMSPSRKVSAFVVGA